MHGLVGSVMNRINRGGGGFGDGGSGSMDSAVRSVLSILSYLIFCNVIASYSVDPNFSILLIRGAQALSLVRMLSEPATATASHMVFILVVSNVPILISHVFTAPRRRGIFLSFVNSGISYSFWDVFIIDAIIVVLQILMFYIKTERAVVRRTTTDSSSEQGQEQGQE
eukprot:ANDGO_03883.mRNA.1 hypothetical protein